MYILLTIYWATHKADQKVACERGSVAHARRIPTIQIESEFRKLVFEERGKSEYPGENLSEQSKEPTTNSTHI